MQPGSQVNEVQEMKTQEFVVCAVSECYHDGDEPDLFEERFFIVEATNEDDARQQVELELSNPHEYVSGTGTVVCWRLRGVVEVLTLYSFDDEPIRELTSRLFDDIESYENFIDSRDGDDVR